MDTMSVWTFGTPEGAEEALRQVERLQLRGRIAVADAAVVAWPSGAPRPRTYQVGAVDGAAALSGAFWGLVFGTVFLLPITGRDVGCRLGHLGFADDLVATLRERVVAGRSALFLLTASGVVATVATALENLGPERWVVDVAPEQRAALWQAFAADDPAVI